MKKKPPGQTKTARTPDNIERVRAPVTRSPGRSARKHARELRMSHESLRTILQKDLKFHPYKMCVVQKLEERDYAQRQEFAFRMQVLLEDNENAVIIMSDETHFHLDGEVNRKNLRYWSSGNPRIVHEKPLHSERVTVWCATTLFDIIGPYFFEDENGSTVTVNAEHYCQMLNTFLRSELHRLQLDLENISFQQASSQNV